MIPEIDAIASIRVQSTRVFTKPLLERPSWKVIGYSARTALRRHFRMADAVAKLNATCVHRMRVFPLTAERLPIFRSQGLRIWLRGLS
jgi:hypothetical protein